MPQKILTFSIDSSGLATFKVMTADATETLATASQQFAPDGDLQPVAQWAAPLFLAYAKTLKVTDLAPITTLDPNLLGVALLLLLSR